MASLYRKIGMECDACFPGTQNNRRKSDLPKKRDRQKMSLTLLAALERINNFEQPENYQRTA